MRQLITLLLFVAFSSSFAQTHEIKAPNFTDISIFGPFKVNLIKASASRAEIDYRSIDPNDVIIRTNGDELEIKLRTSGIFGFNDDNDRRGNSSYATVTIYYTSLEGIEVKGGASLTASQTINSKKLKLTSKMGAQVTLDLQVKELDLNSSMGSDVELTGTAEVADITARMGTSIKASQLKCQDVSVSASMGADVRVYAENELDASANFGASISNKGRATHKHTSTFFGADIN